MRINNILAQSINPNQSEGGLMGENKSASHLDLTSPALNEFSKLNQEQLWVNCNVYSTDEHIILEYYVHEQTSILVYHVNIFIYNNLLLKAGWPWCEIKYLHKPLDYRPTDKYLGLIQSFSRSITNSDFRKCEILSLDFSYTNHMENTSRVIEGLWYYLFHQQLRIKISHWNCM